MQNDKKKILIVEDQQIIAIDLKKALIRSGYIIVGMCDNSDDAVSLARECKPDLVLMDIILNGDKNGIETAELIKKEQDIPIIYLTALTDIDTYLEAIKTEPFKYLMKPVDIESLERAIRDIFETSDANEHSL